MVAEAKLEVKEIKELEGIVEVVCSGWDGIGATTGAVAVAGADVESGTKAAEGAGATDGAATGAAIGTRGAEAAKGLDEGTSLVAGRAKEAKPVVEVTCVGGGRTASSSSSFSTSISSSSIPNLANFLSFFSSSPSLVKKCNSRKAG